MRSAVMCVALAACGSEMPYDTPRVLTSDVDILVMADNSPGTSPKIQELKARFPQLVKVLDDYGKINPIHYHIGVVTSDLGAGMFTLGGGQCRPGGDGGQLQPLGKAHDATCQPPTEGFVFIDYNQQDGTNNLPAGQDLATTFSCMASVGDQGCGFEAPLESVYQALKNPPPVNQGFLREGAQLVVLWVTDEDDCSADPMTNLFDPNASQYGAETSYRCTQYGVACGHPPMLMPYGPSNGPLMDCHGATGAEGGQLFEVSRYVDFFTKPSSQGGVKADPSMVILAAIIAAPTVVESLQIDPRVAGEQQCAGPVDGKTCAVVLQHSCMAPQNPQFFGDPAVRINDVVSAAPNHQITSICDTNYQGALQSLGNMIIASVPGSCVGPLADPSHPDCVVQDLIRNMDGSRKPISLAACAANGNVAPCWSITTSPVCDPNMPVAGCCPAVCATDGDRGQHSSITIARSMSPASDTVTRYSCRTQLRPIDSIEQPPVCGPPL
jgi:hypothetical protein